MTLATILSICMLCSAGTRQLILASLSTISALAPAAVPQTSAQESQNPAPAQNQDLHSSLQNAPASTAKPTPPALAPAQTAAGQEKASKRARRKKAKDAKVASKDSTTTPTNCTPAAAGNTAAGNAGTNSSAAAPEAPASGTAAPAKCPPEKKIVHDGGTTEPAIQLVGGPGGAQASYQRDTTDQLLESVESNLKKVAGRQLSSSQQEMMTQIRQFMEQSKAAVAAGDMERGHNLAMKAQLLSAELVKP